MLFITIYILIVRVEEAVSISILRISADFFALFLGNEVDGMNYNKIVYSSKFKSINKSYDSFSSDLFASKTSMSNLNKRER